MGLSQDRRGSPITNNQMSKIAVITGATSGIGEQFARLLADSQEYDELWMIGRNKSKLDSLKAELVPQKTVCICADLCSTEGMKKIEALMSSVNPDIQLLVNSAGIGFRSVFEDQGIDEISDTLNTNCNALTLICRMCLPYMANTGSGIINIASSAGFVPQPGFAVYAASKSYVISFSRALAAELRDRKIRVTCVCPGPVMTDFQRRATKGGTSDFEGIRSLTAKMPSDIARMSIKANKKGRRLIVCGASQKSLHLASKLLPHQWIINMIKW